MLLGNSIIEFLTVVCNSHWKIYYLLKLQIWENRFFQCRYNASHIAHMNIRRRFRPKNSNSPRRVFSRVQIEFVLAAFLSLLRSLGLFVFHPAASIDPPPPSELGRQRLTTTFTGRPRVSYCKAPTLPFLFGAFFLLVNNLFPSLIAFIAELLFAFGQYVSLWVSSFSLFVALISVLTIHKIALGGIHLDSGLTFPTVSPIYLTLFSIIVT